MAEKAAVFDKIKKDYLLQVANLGNVSRRCDVLGITIRENTYQIPFFNRRYRILSDRIIDEKGGAAKHSTSVILCKYLLLCPDTPADDKRLVTYKDFKDAAPYAGGFKNTAGRPIARHFEGKVDKLEQQCLALGGQPFDTDVACQSAFQFRALPRVPVFLLFNDADDDFPAQCTLLFQINAASYLDMECLAMIGSTLAAWLQDNPSDHI